MRRVAGRHILAACVYVMSGRVVFARPDCPFFWGSGREVVHIHALAFPGSPRRVLQSAPRHLYMQALKAFCGDVVLLPLLIHGLQTCNYYHPCDTVAFFRAGQPLYPLVVDAMSDHISMRVQGWRTTTGVLLQRPIKAHVDFSPSLARS
jgi:hypothetical protein